jgi:hypothetical protein
MKRSFAGFAARVKSGYDNAGRRVAAVGFLVPVVGVANAAAGDGTFDTTDLLVKIAAGLAAGIVVSIAFTGAYLSMRASKLPRKG